MSGILLAFTFHVGSYIWQFNQAGAGKVFYQRTIKGRVALEGVGLHSGERTRVELCPAPPDTGVVFISRGITIKASCGNISDTAWATSLEKDGVKVGTIEHLLAALAALRVDNAYIEIEGPEVPVMDGSALPFVKAIKGVGMEIQKTPRRYIKIVKEITVHDGDKSASVLPATSSRLTARVDFGHPAISDRSLTVDLDPRTFERELAPSRTFGFLKDADMLMKAGLAKGATLDNAVVVGDDGVLNPGGLRFPDEFVRHKMLDMVGDLSLLEMPLIGHIVGDKSGHALNRLLVHEILTRPESWIMVEGEAEMEETALAFAVGQ